ncbi:unnamed protein product [Calicophoron daubneyi]|uniref:carbonyl reductase (NADPH) n=1 Tax=Calicophoron daubneyi TaxID=300641 RepID=A0AAV2TV27_CALDB
MKVAFVTGSNKGIGFAIVERLAKALNPTGEWDVYLTARDETRGKKACEELKSQGLEVKFHQLDITSLESRGQFLQHMKATYPNGINIAINNAGIAYKVNSTAPFDEQARVTIATNFTATLDFTLEFMPLLAKDARVVIVTSMASTMALNKLSRDLFAKFTSPMTLDEVRSLTAEFVKYTETNEHEKHGWPNTAYGVSKLAMTKASFILGEMCWADPRHIVLNACCPGYVDTDMTSHKGTKTPEQGADTPFYLATLPVGVTEPVGQFVSDRKVQKWGA